MLSWLALVFDLESALVSPTLGSAADCCPWVGLLSEAQFMAEGAGEHTRIEAGMW